MSYPVEEMLEMNKFSHLHDGKQVFFCKWEFIAETWQRISEQPNEAILISGNSDNVIDDQHVRNKPQNVIKWFCGNKHSQSDELTIIPIGIENSTKCKIIGHGKVWDHAPEKHKILSELRPKEPTKLVYANFTVCRFSRHASRGIWKSIALESDHITWSKGDLEYAEYCDHILDHEAVLCPLGNIHVPENDNHRIYEVLYAGRIPVIHQQALYKKLYHKFPVILIPTDEHGICHFDAIKDEQFMRAEIDRVRSQTYDDKYLKFSYWKELILKTKASLAIEQEQQ
jgi:hypothetical protein